MKYLFLLLISFNVEATTFAVKIEPVPFTCTFSYYPLGSIELKKFTQVFFCENKRIIAKIKELENNENVNIVRLP